MNTSIFVHVGIAITFALVVAVPAFDRKPPVLRERGEILLADDKETRDPMPGEWVRVRWHVDQYARTCPGVVHRKIIDSHRSIYAIEDDAAISRLPGDDIVFYRSFQLPLKLAPGPAIYKASVTWECNWTHWLWPITTISPDVPFVVATGVETNKLNQLDESVKRLQERIK